ncbi:hypothetical protein H6P81_009732 [Aristolochia fimbriata]|uniref:Serine-threonine/tyrosine-protein kinase catalytic domain-containing protein n=1 Tax=Aristolochia fimbriata TaxID=158543 RepID=A0AAV7ELS2_ARIFI|nr:hypothetical protein H6P81_009732 [Aristolochia fimbriata]
MDREQERGTSYSGLAEATEDRERGTSRTDFPGQGAADIGSTTRAPQVLQRRPGGRLRASADGLRPRPVTRKSDVWSFGILILEILTGKYPANFLHQGGSSGGGSDLAEWVNSIAREASTGAVMDKDMQGTANAQGEMSKLLKIGLSCCELEAEDRWDLATAVQKIEELRETDHDDSGSCASDGDDSSLSRKN